MALGKDAERIASLDIYGAAIPLSFVNPWTAFGMYVLLACNGFIPDRRIERVFVD